MDSSTQADSSAQIQVLPPISGSHVTESQEDVRADQGIVEPQSPTQVRRAKHRVKHSISVNQQTKTPNQ